MKITYNYDRKDIFGQRIFTSDSTYYVGYREIERMFQLFKKDPLSAIHVSPNSTLGNDTDETYSFIWEHYEDCENGLVTMIYSHHWNIKENPETMTLRKAKKIVKEFLK